MNFVSSTVAAALAATMAAGAALAQTEARVDAKQDWSVFEQGEGEARICWIVSEPVESTALRDGQPVQVQRGDIYLMVAMRPAGDVTNEVSMIAGYPFRDGSSVEVDIDGDEFEMFTEGEGAWTDSPQIDREMVDSMRAGLEAELTGVSSRGTTTVDTFSLLGFTAALKAASDRCT